MRETVVIVGGGRVGRHTARDLDSSWYDIRIIEQSADKCRSLLEHEVTEVLEGDGSERSMLEDAGAEDADIVAAFTNDTDTNRRVAELVEEMNPDAKTMVRIAKDGQQDLGHLSSIDNIVYPAAAGAEVAVSKISQS